MAESLEEIEQSMEDYVMERGCMSCRAIESIETIKKFLADSFSGMDESKSTDFVIAFNTVLFLGEYLNDVGKRHHNEITELNSEYSGSGWLGPICRLGSSTELVDRPRSDAQSTLDGD